jgi:transcriptional regulator with XRE-family HTH domain
MENMKELICNNFNRLIDASSLSKREVAKRIKVNENTLQRWKNKESCPELPNIESLAEVLGVSPLEFYRAEEQLKPLQIPVSKTIQKLMAIPDDVYEAAQGVPHGHEIWGIVKDYLENAKEETRLANLLNKG